MDDTLTGGIYVHKVNPQVLLPSVTEQKCSTFGAIADCIERSSLEENGASHFWIDVESLNGATCLILSDNGNGFDQDTFASWLSLESLAVYPKRTDPFLSTLLQMGNEVLILSRTDDGSITVLFVSLTWHSLEKSADIRMPMLSWSSQNSDHLTNMFNPSGSNHAFDIIFNYSPCKSEEDILNFVNKYSFDSDHGTTIVVSNLRRNGVNLEVNFIDPLDIRYLSETNMQDPLNAELEQEPAYKTSLRLYCSIMFLKPKLKISLRGKNVETYWMTKALQFPRTYTNKDLKQGLAINVTVGLCPYFNDYGVMLYHGNRLIKGFKKMGLLRQPSEVKNGGIIAVADLSHLPLNASNKDFVNNGDYKKIYQYILNNLKTYYDYFSDLKAICGTDNDGYILLPNIYQRWLQCTFPLCLKWRQIDSNNPSEVKADNWYCNMNFGPNHRSCAEPEVADPPAVGAYVKAKRKKKDHISHKKRKYFIRECFVLVKRLPKSVVEKHKIVTEFGESDFYSACLSPSSKNRDIKLKLSKVKRISNSGVPNGFSPQKYITGAKNNAKALLNGSPKKKKKRFPKLIALKSWSENYSTLKIDDEPVDDDAYLFPADVPHGSGEKNHHDGFLSSVKSLVGSTAGYLHFMFPLYYTGVTNINEVGSSSTTEAILILISQLESAIKEIISDYRRVTLNSHQVEMELESLKQQFKTINYSGNHLQESKKGVKNDIRMKYNLLKQNLVILLNIVLLEKATIQNAESVTQSYLELFQRSLRSSR